MAEPLAARWYSRNLQNYTWIFCRVAESQVLYCIEGCPSGEYGACVGQEMLVNAVNMDRIDGKGDLTSANAADLLRWFEIERKTARVWFETDIGIGQVAFCDGRVVAAEVGLLRRRSALFRLLGMTEGQYSVEQVSVPAAEPIIPSIDVALAVMLERQQQWRELCESTPPMSSVLRLTLAGKNFEQQAKGPERLVYLLVDGNRTLMDVLGDAAADPIEALQIIVRGVGLEHFTEVSAPTSLLPLPAEELSGEVLKIPPPPGMPRLGTIDTSPIRSVPARSSRPVSSGDHFLRKGTLVGLGVDIASSNPPPRVGSNSIEVSPIISLSNDAHVPDGSREIDAVQFRPVEPELRRTATSPADSDAQLEPDSHSVPLSEPADSLIGSALPQRQEEEAPGEAANRVRYVGRYEVIHRIGRGGMGSVYLSRLTTQGGFRRLFALKLLRSYLAHDGEAAEAFLGEARLAGQLHHPNVVSVVDAGVHRGQPYLVMDYVEGCSLKQLMIAHPAERPAHLIVPIILNALEGLHAVHSLYGDDGVPLEIVHCDVSPENLLIGIDGVCRLTDLGVARRARIDGNLSTHGKPSYLAPEQVTGGAIDRRADIFSMGVVLWTALTGERLFRGASVDETLQRVCSQPILPASSVGLRPNAALDAVCAKALERDPDKRFATAEEMHIALREVALQSGALGLASESAAWVRSTVGRELTQRRLMVLEAARPAGFSMTPPLGEPAQDVISKSDATSSGPPRSRRDDDDSRTIRLADGRGNGSRYVLIGSALLAAGMVIISILWPVGLSKLFRLNLVAQPSTASSIRVNWAAPSAVGETPASRSTSPAPIVTPVISSAPAPGGRLSGISDKSSPSKQ